MANRTRIYINAELQPGTTVTLSKPASHHLCTVLRQQAGDPVVLFNGDGFDYQATLCRSEKLAVLSVQSAGPNRTESPLKIHLLQGISRTERMDTTIQKAVELGVCEITPVVTDKSQIKLKQQRLDKKMAHWRAVIISACEQCQRSTLPRLNTVVSLREYLSIRATESAQNRRQINLVLDPRSTTRIGALQHESAAYQILIGPESGLSDSEIQHCLERDFASISLGPRILRTETAGPATIAILQARFGDLH